MSTQENLNEIKKRLIIEWMAAEQRVIDDLYAKIDDHKREVSKFKMKLKEVEKA